MPEIGLSDPPNAPVRNRGPAHTSNRTSARLRTEAPALEGVSSGVTPSHFVSQNYDALMTLMRGEAQKRSSQNLQSRLNFPSEHETSSGRDQRSRRERSNHRQPVFARIGRREREDEEVSPHYEEEHEGGEGPTIAHARLGQRGVHERLGQRYSPSESPSSPESRDSRRKRRKRNSFRL